MIYSNYGIQQLQKAFDYHGYPLDIRKDHIIVQNSQNQTEEKITQIIKFAGFYPLLSKNKIDGNYAFTIFPYKTPDFFKVNLQNQNISKNVSESYFTQEDIYQLLLPYRLIDKQEKNLADRWKSINQFRSAVTSALNQGLSEIILKYTQEEHPIIEIGSGIGYCFDKSLSSKIIRTQPHPGDCQLVAKTLPDSIFQIDIEGIYQNLSKIQKKVPLFFALNVFDTLSSGERKKSFLQIAELQKVGDRLLIMLDTNPCLEKFVEHLQFLYPNHALFPYYPLTNTPAKISLIIIPLNSAPFQPSANEILGMIYEESRYMMNGGYSPLQLKLNKYHKDFGYTVVKLEDFFVKQIQQELQITGYKSKVYYHNSFTVEDAPKNFTLKQDLIYKFVTDTATLREWSLDDENLVNLLSQKNLCLPPSYYNENFLKEIRENNQKILGAEILVIEAVKS